MALSSSARASGAAITGSEYNALREDLITNHAHSGSRDGGTVDHNSLSNKGNLTHAEIEARLNAIESLSNFRGIVAGRFALGSQESGNGWTATCVEYNGSEGKQVVITFGAGLPTDDPYVVVTMKKGDWNSQGHGDWDAISAGGEVVTWFADGKLNIVYRRAYNLNDGVAVIGMPIPSPFKFDFIAIWT